MSDFLGFLKEWQEEISAVGGLTKTEKRKMILSQQTLNGLRITGIYLKLCT